MEIKHIHARVGVFNGSLFFLVDNRMLRIGVGTPNFNDYGEWRINSCTLSTEPYNPDDNEVELEPYAFNDIEIDETDLKMIEFVSRMSNAEYVLDDEEFNNLRIEFPDAKPDLYGVMYEGKERITILGEKYGELTHLDDWDGGEKTSFEKVFYPIMEGFRLGYLKRLEINKGDK